MAAVLASRSPARPGIQLGYSERSHIPTAALAGCRLCHREAGSSRAQRASLTRRSQSSLQVGSLKGILASANVIEASYVEVVMLSALTNARSPVKSATLSRDILMSSSEAMRSVVAAHLTCHPVASTSF